MTKISVLVADDDSNMMQYYHAILDKADDIKTVAATTVSARVIFLVKEKQPDIILLDHAMLPTDGFKVMAAIHAEMPYQAVILLGGRNNLRETAIEAGAIEYLSVPVTPKDLLDAIRRVGRVRQA